MNRLFVTVSQTAEAMGMEKSELWNLLDKSGICPQEE